MYRSLEELRMLFCEGAGASPPTGALVFEVGGRIDISSRYDRAMTALIEEIRREVAADEFEFSKHAVDQSILRQIRVQGVREALATGQVIEDYLEDKYGASCLICGVTEMGRAIHIQCSYPSRLLVKIITLYEPNLDRWSDNFTKRRSNNDER